MEQAISELLKRVEAILNTSRAVEHDLIEASHTLTAVPVSRSYGYELDPAPFGEPAMILERASASRQTSAPFNGGPDEDQTEDVISHLCQARDRTTLSANERPMSPLERCATQPGRNRVP